MPGQSQRKAKGADKGKKDDLNEENRSDFEEKRKLVKEFIKYLSSSRDRALSRFELWSDKRFEAELAKFVILRRKQLEERRKQLEEDRFEAEWDKIAYSFISHLPEKEKSAWCEERHPDQFEAELRKFAPIYFARKEEARAKKMKVAVNSPVAVGADPLLKCVRDVPVELCDPNACEAVGRVAGTNSNLQCVRDVTAESYDDPNACKAVGRDAGIDSALQCVRDVHAGREAIGPAVDLVCDLQCVCDAPAAEPCNLAAYEAVGQDAYLASDLKCVRGAPVELRDPNACRAVAQNAGANSDLQCVRGAPVESYDPNNACRAVAQDAGVDSKLQCVRDVPAEPCNLAAYEAVGQDAYLVCDLQCVCDSPAKALRCVCDAPVEAFSLVACEAVSRDADVDCNLPCVCDAPAAEPCNLAASCKADGRDANVDCNLRCVCDAPAVEVHDVAACEAAGRKDVDCVLQRVCDAPAQELGPTVPVNRLARSVCVKEESEAFGWNAVWCAEVEAALPPAQPPPVARGVSCSNHTMIRRATLSKKVRRSFLLSDLSLMVSLGLKARCVLPVRLLA